MLGAMSVKKVANGGQHNAPHPPMAKPYRTANVISASAPS